VTASDQQNCVWVGPATPNAAAIQIMNGGLGVGNATFTYNIAPNPAQTPRTASVTITQIGTTATSAVPQSTVDYVVQIIQQGTNPTPIFEDVPASHPFFGYITLAKLDNLTGGCSTTPALYCPDQPATRGQTAVFIVRALTGTDNFTYNQQPFFTDVPPSNPQFKYIQKIKELGITSGCGATTFCPDEILTRGQAAVLLIRAKFPLSVLTTQALRVNPSAYFTDVPASDPIFPFVQKMRELGATSGCSATDYCPSASITRGQLAVFSIRLFFTQIVAYL
jgi:hypothetical protein